MTHRFGRGKELVDLLRKELAIPEGVTRFEVHVGTWAITVRCEYIAQEDLIPLNELFKADQP
jgi:hypothetical protein